MMKGDLNLLNLNSYMNAGSITVSGIGFENLRLYSEWHGTHSWISGCGEGATRGVCGQDDAAEIGRRATPQATVVIVRNRTLK